MVLRPFVSDLDTTPRLIAEAPEVPMYRSPLLSAALLGFVFAACEAPPVEEALPTPADTVAEALASYDASAFDSISWDTPNDAVVRGSIVFQVSCAKCHGTQGLGDGNFVTMGDTIRPPSFAADVFRFKDDLEGLRRHVYTGTEGGMPHWGMAGLKYRDIDAVGRFIQDRLTTN